MLSGAKHRLQENLLFSNNYCSLISLISVSVAALEVLIFCSRVAPFISSVHQHVLVSECENLLVVQLGSSRSGIITFMSLINVGTLLTG